MGQFTLRPYQREAVDGLWRYFINGGTGNPLILLPTGAGKSLTQAAFFEECLMTYPQIRIMCVTHVGELVGQIVSGLLKHWPEAPVGTYAAGLNKRQVGKAITVGSVQSIYRKAHMFGHIDILFVDEAQLISRKSETMYGKLITALRETNPRLKVIGLTATGYRMDSGALIGGEDAIFTDIAHEVRLIDLVPEYLCPLISPKPSFSYDLTGVKKAGGEYVGSAQDAAINTDRLNQSVVMDLYKRGHDRKKWLIFAVSIDHANRLNDLINMGNRRSAVITGDLDKGKRARLLRQYHTGELDCLVNVNVLGIGFDEPGIDLLGFCRGTQSTGLFVQWCGRGMRKHPDKENCLVLDYGNNIANHGPVDMIPAMPPPKKKKLVNLDGEPMFPGKHCPECDHFQHAARRLCEKCGFEFPPNQIAIEEEADTADIMASVRTQKVIDWKPVVDRTFQIHAPRDGRASSIRVTYLVQRTKKQRTEVAEWVCPGHVGAAKENADNWWVRAGGNMPAPDTVDEFMGRYDEPMKCTHVEIRKVDRYWAVDRVGYFDGMTEEEIHDE